MSEFVQWLNSVGNLFILFAIRMLIQSSVLILALWLLDFVLRRRVRAVVRYWIWLLVLVKLVLPPSLSSPTSLISWIGGRLPEAATVALVPEPPLAIRMVIDPPVTTSMPMEAAPLPPATSVPPARRVPLPAAPVAPTALPGWQAMILLAWIGAVIIMLVLLMQRAFFVLALTAQSREAPEGLRALLESCRRHMGVRGAVGVRLSSLSASPSVCGLLRPVILMPASMTRRLEPRQLRSVLFHELAHIKRGDLWINLVQTLLQIAYLYHPLLWLANVHIRRIREQAVDEAVLAAMGEDAEDYPRTLLSISKLAFGQPALSLRLLGVVESKRALTARIRHIASRPFPTSAKLGLAGLALVLTVGAVLLPMARARSSMPPVGELVTPAVSSAEMAPDPRELLDRYRQAVTSWDKSVSMHVEYDHTMAYQGRDFRHWKYDIQHRRDGDRTEWFGRCQFEGKLDGNPYSFNEEFRDLILDEYYLHYSHRNSGEKSDAFIGTDVGEWLATLEVQSPDGGFLQGRTGGIGEATHQVLAMCDSDDVRYVGPETLGGTPCHIVEAKTKYGTFTVWLAPEKGYNALKSVWRRAARTFSARTSASRIRASPTGRKRRMRWRCRRSTGFSCRSPAGSRVTPSGPAAKKAKTMLRSSAGISSCIPISRPRRPSKSCCRKGPKCVSRTRRSTRFAGRTGSSLPTSTSTC